MLIQKSARADFTSVLSEFLFRSGCSHTQREPRHPSSAGDRSYHGKEDIRSARGVVTNGRNDIAPAG